MALSGRIVDIQTYDGMFAITMHNGVLFVEPDLNEVGTLMLKTMDGVSCASQPLQVQFHPLWNTEALVCQGNGQLLQWEMDSRDAHVTSLCAGEGLSSCCYGMHPSTVLYGQATSVHRIDLRAPSDSSRLYNVHQPVWALKQHPAKSYVHFLKTSLAVYTYDERFTRTWLSRVAFTSCSDRELWGGFEVVVDKDLCTLVDWNRATPHLYALDLHNAWTTPELISMGHRVGQHQQYAVGMAVEQQKDGWQAYQLLENGCIVRTTFQSEENKHAVLPLQHASDPPSRDWEQPKRYLDMHRILERNFSL
jgi:hypothetical protein